MSLEQELKAEQVNHLDLSGFCVVASGTPVREALAQMRQQELNFCLITDDGRLVGIFTDRDVLRKVTGAPETWDQPIDRVMTPDPITVQPNSSAADALRLMANKHFRNLPVVDEKGTIVGNMTHQTVINYLAARYPIEILNLPPRPNQFPNTPEGG